ncbi:putative neutral sphingomyelinase [Patella vulgata]|uniref:putative neutral sphingomyelinase n=1 Tax=Patella vulgata TaxID=6465 RepID=UPI0021807036|nr:putative neutral sphingomyelinase [Patella vulgata]XP_050393104.1 putative neutral sphingomyelinase [Patella vulgata]
MVVLKVLTLNCWGIEVPIVCKYRHQRMLAIGNLLSNGEYDILFLQEVWSNSDYKLLSDKLGSSLPYSHYFHSGAIGSGLCIFSKFPIVETLFHRFQINGFPHKIQHGDWFGGKGVGLCKIQVEDFDINLYISHLHAEYSRTNDVYLSHRISQSFELSQFIKHTSQNCHVTIFGGDLNLQTDDLGYKIITSTALLADAWITKKSTKTEKGFTCDRKENYFTSATDYPDGQRIDYLLYRYNNGYNVSVEECNVLYHQVPGQCYPISDHEPVVANFTIDKSPNSKGFAESITQVGRNQHLQDALEKLDTGMKEIRNDRMFFSILCVIMIVLVFIIPSCEYYSILTILLSLIEVVLVLGAGFSVIYGLVIKLSEENSLYSTKSDILNLLGKPIKQ